MKMKMHRNKFILSIFLLLVGCSAVEIPVHDVQKQKSADHYWKEVLKKNVNAKGQIDFAAIKENPVSLEIYLNQQLAKTPRSHPNLFKTKKEQLVYYVNTYNAIAMYHAAASDVKPKQLAKFFALTKFKIGGEKVSLHTLENKWIRPLNEPRIHFVLNCMVKSCPRLINEPIQLNKLEQQLQNSTIEFLNDANHVKVDKDSKKVHVSAIMKWYKKDFLTEHDSLLSYINSYRKLKIPSDYKLEYLDYDWSLNQK